MDIQALQQSLRRYADELLRFAEQTGIALADTPGAKTHVLVDWENVQPNDDDVRALVPEATDLWLFHGPNQKNVAAQHAAFGERATPIRIARTGKNALDFHLSFYIGYIASRQPDARFVVISNDKGYEPMLDHAEELGFAASRVGFTRKKAVRAPAKRAVAKRAAPPTAAPTRAPRRARAAPVPAPAPAPAPVEARVQAPVTKPAPAKKAAAAKKATSTRKAAAKKAPPAKTAASRPAAPKPPPARTGRGKKTFEQVLEMLQKRPANRLPRKPASLLADIAQMIGAEADSPEAAAMLDRLVASGRVFVDGQKAVSYTL